VIVIQSKHLGINETNKQKKDERRRKKKRNQSLPLLPALPQASGTEKTLDYHCDKA
jgi:hypothetical protein